MGVAMHSPTFGRYAIRAMRASIIGMDTDRSMAVIAWSALALVVWAIVFVIVMLVC